MRSRVATSPHPPLHGMVSLFPSVDPVPCCSPVVLAALLSAGASCCVGDSPPPPCGPRGSGGPVHVALLLPVSFLHSGTKVLVVPTLEP